MVLLATEGTAKVEIATRLDTSAQAVCPWRKRFFECRLKSLEDRHRSGRLPGPFPLRSTPRSRLWRALSPVDHRRCGSGDLSGHDLGEAALRCHQGLAAPLVDTPQRSCLRHQGGVGLDLYARIFAGQPDLHQDLPVRPH
ncbi:MAG: hypothetical protein ACYC1D_16965 [Acidimicrobiales bacterium]